MGNMGAPPQVQVGETLQAGLVDEDGELCYTLDWKNIRVSATTQLIVITLTGPLELPCIELGIFRRGTPIMRKKFFEGAPVKLMKTETLAIEWTVGPPGGRML